MPEVMSTSNAISAVPCYRRKELLENEMTRAQQERVKNALASYTENATKSAETARDTLVREGIYLENGTLAPNYSRALKTA